MQSTPRAVRREADRAELRPSRRMALPERRRGAPVQFVRDTYGELQKVVWPSRQQTTNLTTVVIVVSLAVGGLLGVIDWLFSQIVRRFLVPLP